MALEVNIEKQLSGFRLAVRFTASGAPLGLLGPSGSGKSITLRAIAGLETPDRGRIVLHDRVLFDSNLGINVPARLRRIGLLFQSYALFPHLTVSQNIGFGLDHLAASERSERVDQQMAGGHLADLAARYPGSLSGGEQQRVALCRALATDPEALLLDEPFSALDTHLRSALERQLSNTLTHFGGATIFVSHNLEEVYRLCGELVILTHGTVAAQGPKEEIFRRPPNIEVARLTGCKNFSRARMSTIGCVEAMDWGCSVRVNHALGQAPGHVAIRAHHIRVSGSHGAANTQNENIFPCWLAAMTETPFRVTLDLRIGAPPTGAEDFHVQAEIFKQEWEAFEHLPQPWQIQLPPDRLFLLSD